jgi:Tfp pilus assembly protein PilZ
MVTEKRTGTRWRYFDSVIFRSKSASGEGQLMNLSAGGLFVRTNRFPALGDLVHVTMLGTAPRLTLEAHVRWAGSRRDGAIGFGAELLIASQAYRDIVRSLTAIGSVDRLRRTSPRLELSIPVGLVLESGYDTGILCEIGLSGARLEETSIQPPMGSEVFVSFAVLGDRRPIEIQARVARFVPEGGYAVEFEAVDPKLKVAFEHVHAFIRKLPDI